MGEAQVGVLMCAVFMDTIVHENEERRLRWVALRRLRGCIEAVAPAPGAEECTVAVLAGFARRVPVFCAGWRTKVRGSEDGKEEK